jgi:hypothetical protein
MSDDDIRPRFGDAEPEDSWDPDDPVVDLLYNLERRVFLLRGITLRERLERLVEARESIGRERDLNDRDRVRLEQLGDDIEHLRQRFDNEEVD